MFMKFLCLTMLTLSSVSALAASSGDGAKIGLCLLRTSDASEGPTLGDNDRSLMTYDVKLGYLSSSIYFGVIYNSRTELANSFDDKRTGYGATIGYHNQGWFADLSYFFSAERDLGTFALKSGSGLGFDVGYNAMVGSNFFAGAQLSYKSFTFEKVEDVSQTNKVTSELYPMLNIGVMF